MSLLTALSGALAIAPVLLLAIYAIEVAAGFRPIAPLTTSGETPRTVVLVPAHDEARGIGDTVRALVAQGGPMVSVLVAADNCTDDTAARARAAGATVVERTDPVHRGKGHALAFGRDALASAPPECVIVLDADCAIDGAGATGLARAAVATGRAVQSRNLQRPDSGAPPTVAISGFAFLVKNLVRQRGMARLGGVAALTGTGMALPWPLFRDAPLASSELAEDLSLGVWLTRAGRPPLFLEAAHVWSDAASGRDLLTQRNRWERGFIATARRQALPLVAAGLTRLSRSRLWLGLHLLVPPLALLLAAAITGLGALLVLAFLGASLAPALVLAGMLAAATAATVLAWALEGRDQVSGRALLRAPSYILMKLPLYRAMLGRKEERWVRTRRPGEGDRPL